MNSYLNNIINKNNNDFLFHIIKQLENIINDSNNDKQLSNIINQIKNIIVMMNKFILDNKNNIESIKSENKQFHSNIVNKFDELRNDISNRNINISQKIEYDNGKYVGEIKNNMRDGKGVYYYNSDNRYEGDWKNDKREGKGILISSSGAKYEGDWKNDKKEGKGIFYYNKGDKYEGE